MSRLRSTRSLLLGSALALGCAHGTSATGLRGLDISLPDVDGEYVTPTAAHDRELFLLVFWATWCQPCQQELTKLNVMHDALEARGVQIFAISIDGPSTSAQVGPWVEREGYRFTVLLDRETQVLTRYNPRGEIPYYVVLDAEGRVLKDHQTYMPGDMKELQAFFDSTLPPG